MFPQSGIIAEDESAVVPVVQFGNVYRPAECGAKLVSIKRRLCLGGQRKEVLRIQLSIAQKLKKRSMDLVAARLCGNQNHAGATPELSRVSPGQHFKLAHGFDRRRNNYGIEGVLVVVDAVHHPRVGIGVMAERVEIGSSPRIESTGAGKILAYLARGYSWSQVHKL